MISAAYLHEYDALDTFVEETHHIMNDLYDARNELIATENYIDEKVFMGESADDYEVMLEEAKKNVFAKIGDAVIAFFKSVVDMLAKAGTKLKDSLMGIKKHCSSADDVLKEQMKNDPELAKKFINSVMSGNIKIHDVKDMEDLLKTAQELTDQLNSGKIDEKDYMAKIDTKLEKYASRAKSISAILGVVVGATGILAFIEKVRGGTAKQQEENVRLRDSMNAMKEKMMREANKEAGGHGNRVSVALAGHRKIMAELGKDYSLWGSFLSKVEGGLANLVGKVDTGYNRKDRSGPIERTARRQREAEDTFRRQERIRQEEQDRVAQQREQRQARQRQEEERRKRDEFNRQHNQRMREEYHKGFQNELGRQDARASRGNQ